MYEVPMEVRSIAFPGARLTDGFKLSDMDAENWTESFGRAVSTLRHEVIIPTYFILHNWAWTNFSAGRLIHSFIHSLPPESHVLLQVYVCVCLILV